MYSSDRSSIQCKQLYQVAILVSILVPVFLIEYITITLMSHHITYILDIGLIHKRALFEIISSGMLLGSSSVTNHELKAYRKKYQVFIFHWNMKNNVVYFKQLPQCCPTHHVTVNAVYIFRLVATLVVLSEKLGAYKTVLETKEKTIPFYSKFGFVAKEHSLQLYH